MPISEEAPRLNGPMVARLRTCAADTSSNWDGKITIYPPEARELVALIDDVRRLARRLAVRFESETKLREALAALNAAAYVQEEPSKDLLDASALADELLGPDSRPNPSECGEAR